MHLLHAPPDVVHDTGDRGGCLQGAGDRRRAVAIGRRRGVRAAVVVRLAAQLLVALCAAGARNAVQPDGWARLLQRGNLILPLHERVFGRRAPTHALVVGVGVRRRPGRGRKAGARAAAAPLRERRHRAGVAGPQHGARRRARRPASASVPAHCRGPCVLLAASIVSEAVPNLERISCSWEGSWRQTLARNPGGALAAGAMSGGGGLGELSAFCKTMQELKAMVGDLVEEKRKGAAAGALTERGRKCVVKMAEVRKVNRDAHEAADRLLAAAEAERAETDIISQQLQNLQYQKIHLSRELQMCLAYKGVEDLELISEADFEACTPEEQRGGARGTHAYELARLTAEMKKREDMIKTLKQQDLRRRLLEGKLENQRKFLDSLQGHRETLHAAAEPIRKEFTRAGPLPSLDASLDSATAAAAQLLPAPLYAIYYQAHAYEVSFREETTVSIEGDVAAAQAFTKSQANNPTSPKALSPTDSKKRRKRKGEEREDKGEDVMAPHPLRVHIKIPPAAGSKAPALSLTFSYLHILQVVTVRHSVSASIGAADEAALLQDLYPNDAGELSPLISSDYLLAAVAAKKGTSLTGARGRDALRFDESLSKGRAYKWAQRVAGLRYPPREPAAGAVVPGSGGGAAAGGEGGGAAAKEEKHALQPLAYGALLKVLRKRVELSFQLKALLSELQSLSHADSKGQGINLPAVPGSQDLPAFGAVLTGWTEVTKEVLAAQAAADGAEDELMGDGEGEERAGDEEGEVSAKPAELVVKGVLHPTEKHAAQMARKGHRFFRAKLSKTVSGSSAPWIVQAEVELAGGYPDAAPVWSLKEVQCGAKKKDQGQLAGADVQAAAAVAAARQRGEETNTQLKSIEAELNVYAAAQAAAAGCPAPKLLVFQLWAAVHCFAMYADAESGQALPTARLHRGRARRLPFLWNAQSNSLEQRS